MKTRSFYLSDNEDEWIASKPETKSETVRKALRKAQIAEFDTFACEECGPFRAGEDAEVCPYCGGENIEVVEA